MAIVGTKATAAASLATAAKRRMAQARVSWFREEWALPRGRNARRAIAALAVEASAVLRPDQPAREVVGALCEMKEGGNGGISGQETKRTGLPGRQSTMACPASKRLPTAAKCIRRHTACVVFWAGSGTSDIHSHFCKSFCSALDLIANGSPSMRLPMVRGKVRKGRKQIVRFQVLRPSSPMRRTPSGTEAVWVNGFATELPTICCAYHCRSPLSGLYP